MVTVIETIPVLIFVGLPTTFLITYAWSVYLGHVYPIFPSISDTGTIPPESCLFSMMLNITAATMGFAVYIRHKQIVEIFRSKSPPKFAKLVNRIATITGLVGCVGLDLVANFQETNVLIVHNLGALICFWSFVIYIGLQVMLSYWIVPEMNGMSLVVIRAIQGFIALALLIIEAVTQSISLTKFGAKQNNNTMILEWTPDEPGWAWHIAASVCEWLIVLIFGSFILTYHWDFKKIALFAPELELLEDENDEQEGIRPTNFRSLGPVSY